MKRLSMALAPALMTSALLGMGVASQAQTNLLSLVGNVGDFVKRGDVLTLQLRGDTPGDVKATTFQSLIRYDATKMDVTFTVNSALESASTGNNILRSVTVSSGAYAGVNIMKQSTYGLSASTNGLDLNDTLLGTYEIRVLADATGGFVDFGLSNAVINDFTLAAGRRSLITGGGLATTFGGDGQLRPGAFRVGIVPGPSSLAVFAMGGLAPAMALLRRRRKSK